MLNITYQPQKRYKLSPLQQNNQCIYDPNIKCDQPDCTNCRHQEAEWTQKWINWAINEEIIKQQDLEIKQPKIIQTKLHRYYNGITQITEP